MVRAIGPQSQVSNRLCNTAPTAQRSRILSQRKRRRFRDVLLAWSCTKMLQRPLRPGCTCVQPPSQPGQSAAAVVISARIPSGCLSFEITVCIAKVRCQVTQMFARSHVRAVSSSRKSHLATRSRNRIAERSRPISPSRQRQSRCQLWTSLAFQPEPALECCRAAAPRHEHRRKNTAA